MNQESIVTYLLRHHIKPSVQRIAIMDYLDANRTHPTADTVFNDLYPSIPTLSKTTVYNTLKLLVANGAIQMLTIDEKNARFDADISRHAHFQCKGCGCVYDLSLDLPETIYIDNVGELLVEETQVYCKGYCKICLELKEENQSN